MFARENRMSQMAKPTPDRPALDALIAASKLRANTAPQWRHWAEQAAQMRSWAIGDLLIRWPQFTREQAAEIVDKAMHAHIDSAAAESGGRVS